MVIHGDPFYPSDDDEDETLATKGPIPIRHVIRRNGSRVPCDMAKIRRRVEILCKPDLTKVDVEALLGEMYDHMVDNMPTHQIDDELASIASFKAAVHVDYDTLAARICASNTHKRAPKTFSMGMELCYANKTKKKNLPAPLVSDEFITFVRLHADALDAAIQKKRDYRFSYVGHRTWHQTYLTSLSNGVLAECPQYVYMRAAVFMYRNYKAGDPLARIIAAYDCMSMGLYTPATPTLTNAGKPNGSASSCFTITIKDDSIEGMYETLKDVAMISKASGGIGLDIMRIRSAGSYIAGTNGTSTGIVPMLRVYNDAAVHVDQGGNRRPGAVAIYLEPWHGDIMEFLDLKKNTDGNAKDGTDKKNDDGHMRARDLFYGLWINDLLMERLEANSHWTLFSPSEVPGLYDTWGDEFKTMYEMYERIDNGSLGKRIRAADLWMKILESQIETGTPYMLYKDACNRKTNQQHLGTIHLSNLCVAPETLLLTDKGQFPIAGLAGQTVRIWNGHEWSETTVIHTNSNAEVLTIHFIDHVSLECSAEHKFFLSNGMTVDAADLQPGDKLAPYLLPGSLDHLVQVVKRVEETGRRTSTFCVTEPLRNAATFNDVVTGNCTEIIQYTNPEEISVCNLSTLCLPAYVRRRRSSPGITPPLSADGSYDFGRSSSSSISYLPPGIFQNQPDHLYNAADEIDAHDFSFLGDCDDFITECDPYVGGSEWYFDFRLYARVCAMVNENLNAVIDNNCLPVEKARRSDKRHRTVGAGVQGQADACIKLGIPYDSPEGRMFNSQLMETLYFFSLVGSSGVAMQRRGNLDEGCYDMSGVYESYGGCPMSRGFLHMDLLDIPVDIVRQSKTRDIAVATMKERNLMVTENCGPAMRPGNHRFVDERDDNFTHIEATVVNGFRTTRPVRTRKMVHFDYARLRKRVANVGAANALLVAPPPTASTSVISKNNESFMPILSLYSSKNMLAGEFLNISRAFSEAMGDKWPQVRRALQESRGSAQGIPEIPLAMQQLYRTAIDIPNDVLLEMAAERGRFIDQSQSLNVHVKNITGQKLSKIHTKGWRLGLATGSYYCRDLDVPSGINFSSTALEAASAQQKKVDNDGAGSLTPPAEEGPVTTNHLKRKFSDETTPGTITPPPAYEESKKIRLAEEEALFCTKKEGCLSCSA